MKKNLKILIVGGVAIQLLYVLYLLLPCRPGQRVLLYMGVGLAAFVVMLLLARFLRGERLEKHSFLLIVGAALLFQMTLLAMPPDLSDDIYRYVWDGKLQFHGISPYAYAPADPILRPYHSRQLPARINFPHIKTIYPPAAQAFFTFSYAIFGENPAGLKFLFVLVNMASILLFYRLALRRGKSLALLLLFAWNPLLVMETAVNGHLDVLFLFFLLSALLFFYGQRWLFSGIALGLSVLSKWIPLVALPFFVLELIKKRMKGKPLFLFVVPFAATLGISVLPYWRTIGNALNTAVNYTSYWYFNSPHFHLLLAIFKNNVTAHRLMFLLLLVFLAAVLLWRMKFEKKIFLCFFGVILLNPAIYPWYLIVLLGLQSIHENRTVIYWSGLIYFSYVVMYRYQTTGVWHDSMPVMLSEYAALAAMVLWHWRAETRRRQGGEA